MITKVNDKWIFLLVYPFIAVLTVHIGNDNSFQELLSLPSYYTDLLFALICTYTAGWYFRWLFFKLDRRFNWDTQLRQRLIFQFIYGLMIPIMAIISVEMIYLEFLLGLAVSQSSIFYLELPLIAIFCIIINLIYLMLYHRQHYFATTGNIKKQSSYKNNFVVHAGIKSINIPENDVSYFIIQEKSTFVTTCGGRQYLYDDTLEQIRKDISPMKFFQLNRQIIAHRRSIVSYERTDTRKLSIELTPKVVKPVFVSKTKTSEFLHWLNQK